MMIYGGICGAAESVNANGGHSVVFLTEMQFAHHSVGSVLSRRNLNAIEGVEASGIFENQ